jgi:hypothetical protein
VNTFTVKTFDIERLMDTYYYKCKSRLLLDIE